MSPPLKGEFQHHYHNSPGKWLTDKRLEYAKHLLETSKKSVSEVADACGFENPAHFSRVFKEKTGMAPLQFRKNGQ